MPIPGELLNQPTLWQRVLAFLRSRPAEAISLLIIEAVEPTPARQIASSPPPNCSTPRMSDGAVWYIDTSVLVTPFLENREGEVLARC